MGVGVGVRRHNQLLAAGRALAAELEPDLVDDLERLFGAAADEAARAFSRKAISYLAASAYAESDETVAAIRAVAEEHAPDGGYGETAWHAADGAVFWVCGDWTSSEEVDAAELAFLAIDGVDSFEHEAEAALPEGDGWEQVWPVRRSLSAAAPLSTSTMVALYPNPDEAAALAVEDGEEPSILHVTLAYLGETTDQQAAAAALLVEQVALEHVPREGTVGGLGAFGTERDFDGQTFYPSIALPDVPGMAELRHSVARALDEAGIPFGREHDFNPHLTLAYTEAPSMPPADRLGLPLTFSRLTLTRGDVPQHFRLGGEGNTEEPAEAALAAAGDPPKEADWAPPNPDEVLYIPALADRLRARSEPARRAVAARVMTEPLDGLGLSFDVENPLVGAALAGSGRQVTFIAETTRADVMRAIASAHEAGLSIPNTAELIRAAIKGSGRSRAQTIARTELNRVANASSVAAVQTVASATGDTYLKRWLTADGAANPRHEEYDGLDGQTVGLEEPFDVGGYEMQYPGDDGGPPEESILCRCSLEYVSAAEEGETDEEGGAGQQDAALASAHAHRRGRRGAVMARGGSSRGRRTARRAAERVRGGAQGLNEAPGSTLTAAARPTTVSRPARLAPALSVLGESVSDAALSRLARRSRRHDAVLAALTAAGVQTDVETTFDMGRLQFADRAFAEAVLEAGYQEASGAAWPCEAELGDHGEVVYRYGGEGVFRLKDGSIVYASIDHGWAYVRCASPSRASVAEVLAAFATAYPPLYRDTTDDAGLVPITFWSYGQFGPQSRLRMIEAGTWEQIGRNYPGAVRDELDRLMGDDFAPGKDGQLILWQGEPGTGKTWALRALASEWSDWAEFHYITDPDAFFVKNPDYLIDVLLHETYEALEPAQPGESPRVVSENAKDGKWRVLILEDTGELLSANAKEAYGQGLSRLLNVVDGMVGQGLKVLALVTMNDELGDLHPAAVRPGRCASQIEFGPFSPEEAAAWLGDDAQDGPLTLAELYARGEQVGVEAFAPMDECACGHLADDHVGGDGACTADGCDCEQFEIAEDLPDEGDALEASARLRFTPQAISAATAALLAGASVVGRSPNSSNGDPPAGHARELQRMVLDFQTVDLPPELAPRDEQPEMRPGPAAPADQPTRASAMRWEAIFAPEGAATDDGRMFAPGAITWRELPLTLMGMVQTADGHDGAEVCGRIDAIWRDGSLIRASGVFDEGDFGCEIARMVAEGVLRGLSVDIAIRAYEVVYESDVLDEDGNYKEPDPESDSGEPDLVDLLFGPDDRVIFLVTEGVIGAATVCPFPAFAEAQISLAASGAVWNWTAPALFTVTPAEGDGLTAAAEPAEPEERAAPVEPPAAWFADPQLEQLTAIAVDDDGRIFGHAAAWDTCHIGIPEVCTTAPHSLTDYALFHRAEVRCDDGRRVTSGPLTLGTGHADRKLGPQAAIEHYDDTGTAVADVQVGEDEHGIWVAGALRPDVSPERLRELRGSVLSGDWRSINGNLELVALLCVNVGGFPIPRPRALVASGEDGSGFEVLTLISAGIHDGRTGDEVEAEVMRRFSLLETAAVGGFAALAARARGEVA